MISYQIIISAAVALIITAVSGFFLIPYLRKLKFGQTIREEGPLWHKLKQGTPTMGGLMFALGITVALVTVFYIVSNSGFNFFDDIERRNTIKLIAGFVMALAYGFTGFIDDYIKVVKKRNLGLTATQKIVMQVLIAVIYLGWVYISGDNSTGVRIPFIGEYDFGILYYPFAVFLIVGFVNAVNLTDGIDGLACSVTLMVALGFTILSGFMSFTAIGMLATATAGGCLGFLIWNFNPAKVFMGDTGSMFLGGLVCALAFGVDFELLLPIIGIIYLIEAFSVILQVISFKLTGKRLFKMSPIHHHYEMSGWSENKIVMVFSFITVIGICFSILAASMI